MSTIGGKIPVIVAPSYVNGTGVVREMAAKGARVVAVDSSPLAPGLHSRHAFERVVCESPGEREGAFAEYLLSRRDLYGALVMPTDDFHMRELYRHRDELDGKFTLCISEGDAVKVALHKDLADKAALDAGVAAPKTVVLSERRVLEDAVKEVGLPAIVKPVFSITFHTRFKTKAFVVNTPEEARCALARAEEVGEKVMLQEIIPGGDEEMAAHVSYWDAGGTCAGEYVFEKTRQYPPIFGVGQFVTVIDRPDVAAEARRYLKAIGLRGSIATVEFKRDHRDATWKLIDANLRTPMQSALGRPAGCDVIDMLWRDKLGLEPGPKPRVRYGTRWIYLKHGILRYRGYPEHRKGLVRYLKGLGGRLVFGLLSREDPRPFLVDMAPVLRRRYQG